MIVVLDHCDIATRGLVQNVVCALQLIGVDVDEKCARERKIGNDVAIKTQNRAEMSFHAFDHLKLAERFFVDLNSNLPCAWNDAF